MGWYVFEGLINALEMSVTLYLAESLFRREGDRPVPMAWRAGAVAVGDALLLLCTYGNTGLPDIVPCTVIFFLYSVFLLHAAPFPALMWSLMNCAVIGFCTFSWLSLLSTIAHVDTDIFFTESTHRILFVTLTQITRISLTVLLARWFGRRRSFLLRKGWWLFVGIPLFSIYVLFMFAEYDGIGFNGISPTYVNVSVFVGLLAVNVGLLFFFAEVSRTAEEALLAKARSETATMQLRHQEEVFQSKKEIRMLRHDIKNHLYALRGLMNEQAYDRLDQYLQDLTEHFEIQNVLVSTGNLIADALLSAKISLAKSKGIQVSLRAGLSDRFPLTDEKLCVLLGNLMDNAYDACMRMQDGERRIELEILERKGSFIIHCINTTDGREARWGNRWLSLKSDPLEHGFGLQSIDDIVAECGGSCQRKHAGGLFTCTIVLPAKDG